MKHKPLLLAITLVIITSGLTAQVTDKDGNTYKTVKIGTQEWITSNLNVSHFRNGDVIPEIEDATAWVQASNNGTPAWCYYNSDAGNGSTYGKLYNWYAVNDSRGLAPYGWHIPTYMEWDDLTTYSGGEMYAGKKLKSTNGWNNSGNKSGNGTNESGFSGLPCGARHDDDGAGSFYGVGQYGHWWSCSLDSDDPSLGLACDFEMDFYEDDVNTGDGYSNGLSKGRGLSVRCLRN
jgi:uncharacterized protein (TIGR02145 family)